MDDPRIAEVRKIKIDRLRILRTPPIIFLCGGKIDKKGGDGVSARNSFIHHLAVNDHGIHESITIAENFSDWMDGSTYDDLVEFESDIAGISSVIVLILESAGALVEFGLFVADETLKKKTVAIISNQHYESDSFIRLGPIKHLQEKVKDQHVCAYDWDILDVSTLKVADVELMRIDLEKITEELPKSEEINAMNDGHLALIVFELTKAFHAILFSEIHDYISIILGRAVPKRTIKRALFLLEKFGLLRTKRKGHYTYYLPTPSEMSKERVDFDGSFNIARATIESKAFYDSEIKESRRAQIISAIDKEGIVI